VSGTFSDQVPGLLQRHLAHLRDGSGLPLEVIRERGYRSVLVSKDDLADLGFAAYQQRVPALLVPVCPPDGSNGLYQIKPDYPRTGQDGKTIKYETQAGRELRLDVPPRCRPLLADPTVPLWITEGAKKADKLAAEGACAVSVMGVWSFQRKDVFGQPMFLGDWDAIALAGRDVRIAYDSDVSVKTAVQQATARLAAVLSRRGARVRAVRIPDGAGGAKQGVDDFLLTHTLADLGALPFVSFGSGSGTAEGWPEPDRLEGPPPAPALPLALLPKEIADVGADTAERIGCPVDYPAWSGLVTSATLVGRDAGIRVKLQDDWTERLALDVALIGDPSTLKSPGQYEGTRPLRRQQVAYERAYEAAVEMWKEECAALREENPQVKASDLPPAPVMQRCFTADVTVEKLATMLVPDVSRGFAVVRDELAGWFRDLNKYRNGGDREFFLTAYSGGPYPVDRIGRGTLLIPDVLVNILGGVQPEKAAEMFAGGPDDGLAARFTCVWPEPALGDDADRWPNKAARDALDKVNDTLASYDWRAALWSDDYNPTPYCRLDADGAALFARWRSELRRKIREGAYEGRLAERVGKYPGLAARLILLFHLVDKAARRVASAKTPPAETVVRVLNLVDNYVLPMDLRVHAQFAVTPAAAGGRRVARWLLEARPERFTARDVRRHEWSGLDTPETVAAALEWLAARRWIREEQPDPFARGRPPAAYLLNPRIPRTDGARP
jgi:hypothetical protein